jgi:hypothetical protein
MPRLLERVAAFVFLTEKTGNRLRLRFVYPTGRNEIESISPETTSPFAITAIPNTNHKVSITDAWQVAKVS